MASPYDTIQADAAEAQEFIAQMGGKAATGNNALLNGSPITVAFGDQRGGVVMNVGGGDRMRAEIPATIVRSQIPRAPVANEDRLTRTDITPHIEYRIDTVETHDPHRYHLVLLKVGL